MKNVRSIALLLVAMVLTIGVADAQTRPKLVVWGDANQQASFEAPFAQILSLFKQKYPNVDVQLDFAQTNETTNVAVATNSLPDLFWVQGDKTPKMKEYVQQGLLLDLTGKIDTSRYSQSEISYATVNGRIYSAPPSFLDSIVVYYNKAIFQRYKLTPPKTWADFETICATIAKTTILPIAEVGTDDWNRSWPLFAFLPAMANAQLDMVMKGTGRLTDPAIAAGFQKFADFAQKGWFGKDASGATSDGAMLAFAQGKAAMKIDGTWAAIDYAKTGVDVGYFYIPNDKGEKIAMASLSNFLTYAVNAKTKYPKEAAALANFFASQQAQQILADAVGLIPTLKDITPASDRVNALSSFDRLGYNIYSVLTALASDKQKPNDIFLTDVSSKLLLGKMNGTDAVKLLDAAATYKK